jgi:PPOX class probable F420-dependent enzyme
VTGNISAAPIDPALRAWLTRELRYPVMAVLRPDGTPSLSVMWAVVQADGSILMNTRYDREKARCLRRDPRTWLCFEDGVDYVTLEGSVTFRDDPECVDIHAIRDHYGATGDFSPQRGERVTLLMTVERARRHVDGLGG